MKMNGKTRKIAYFGLNVALAFVLSYLESLIPFNFGVPGIKLGLANLAVLPKMHFSFPLSGLCLRELHSAAFPQ